MTRTKLHNPSTGQALPCCWDNCWNVGYEEFKIIVPKGPDRLHYIFCSLGHREFYYWSSRSYGNVR